MPIALILTWVIWLVLAIIYIILKRGDWYLWLFPPLAITIVGVLLWFFSEVLGIIFVAVVHIYIVSSAILRYFKKQ